MTGDMEDLGMTVNLNNTLVLDMALKEAKQYLVMEINVQGQ